MSFYKFAALSRPSLFSLKARLCSSMASDRVFTNSRGVKCVLPRLPPSISKVFTPGQMYRYQESVKKLPVMPLDYILGKYLETVEVCYSVCVSLCLLIVCEFVVVFHLSGLVIIKSASFLQFVHRQ